MFVCVVWFIFVVSATPYQSKASRALVAFPSAPMLLVALAATAQYWPQLHDLSTPCSSNYSSACAIREAGRLVSAVSLGLTRKLGSDVQLIGPEGGEVSSIDCIARGFYRDWPVA